MANTGFQLSPHLKLAPAVLAGSHEEQIILWAHRQRKANPPSTPTRKPKTTVPKWRTPKGLIDQAAAFMRVSRRTVQRYLKYPEKIPSEWEGFGPAALASEGAFQNWKMGIGVRESGGDVSDKASAALLERGGWHKTGPR